MIIIDWCIANDHEEMMNLKIMCTRKAMYDWVASWISLNVTWVAYPTKRHSAEDQQRKVRRRDCFHFMLAYVGINVVMDLLFVMFDFFHVFE